MCILTNLSGITIDILLSCTVLVGLLSNVYGLIKIRWEITYEIYHLLFVLSSIFLIITFIFCIVILFFRIENTINTIWNRSMKYIVYFLSVINVIGLVITLISFINTSKLLSSPDDSDKNLKTKLFFKEQKNYIFLSMSLVSIFYVLQFPLWYSSLRRIQLKTIGSLRTGDFVIISN